MSDGTPIPPPGQFLDLSGISALNAQRETLKEQMLRARELGRPSGRKFATWGGALAGGLGDVFGAIAGNVKESRLADALAANQRAEQGKLGEFNTAMSRPGATPEEQELLALQAIATGHHGLGETGKAWLDYGGKKLTRAMQEEERKKAAERARIDDERAQKALELKEKQDEWNRTHPAQTYVVGQDNQIYAAPTHVEVGTVPIATPAQTAPAVPPPGSQPLRKPNEISEGRAKALQEAAESVAGINELADTFKPEFVGGGVVGGKVAEVTDALGGGGGIMGKVIGAGSQALGGPGEEAIKERKVWWQKYDRLINLPDRNEVFGASLSAGEKSSWAAAQDVARGSDRVAAARALQWMRTTANEKLTGLRESSLSEGANPKAVEGLTRRAGSQPPAAPPIDTSAPVQEPPPPVAPKRALPRAAVGPHGPSVVQDGVTYNWNPRTGQYEE